MAWCCGNINIGEGYLLLVLADDGEDDEEDDADGDGHKQDKEGRHVTSYMKVEDDL